MRRLRPRPGSGRGRFAMVPSVFRRMAAGGDGSTLRLHEAATGKQVHELTGHAHWVQHSAFTPDGKQLVTASMDKTLRLWDVATGKELRKFEGHTEGVLSVAVSPD